jgi:hypothetical protein
MFNIWYTQLLEGLHLVVIAAEPVMKWRQADTGAKIPEKSSSCRIFIFIKDGLNNFLTS